MKTSVSYRMLAMLAYFGSLFLIDNPFWQLPQTLKFSLFFGLQVLGCAMMFRRDDLERLNRPSLTITIFIVFYAISVARFNPVSHAYDRDVSPILGVLTMLTFSTSIFFSRYLDVRSMAKALLVVLLPISLVVIYHFNDLTDPSLSTWYTVGDLSYGSYQTVSEILSLTGLSALYLALSARGAGQIALAGVFVLCMAYVFQGLGRGEAIAFIIATALLISPRATIVAAPFFYSLMRILAFAIDTPLTERMRLIFEGNYGERDYLLENAVTMLHDKPGLILFGGGMNYFQRYWNLPAGLYPHNIATESLITGGIMLLISVVALFMWPIVKLAILAFRRRLNRNEAFALAIMTFVILLALKSGSLLSMWETMIFAGLFWHVDTRCRPQIGAITKKMSSDDASIPTIRSLTRRAL